MIDTERIRTLLGDLPALTVTTVDDMFTDAVAVRVTQDLGDPRGELHYFTSVPGGMVADNPAKFTEAVIAHQAGHVLRPWLRPDPPAIPEITLFPALARLRRRRGHHQGITRRTFL